MMTAGSNEKFLESDGKNGTKSASTSKIPLKWVNIIEEVPWNVRTLANGFHCLLVTASWQLFSGESFPFPRGGGVSALAGWQSSDLGLRSGWYKKLLPGSFPSLSEGRSPSAKIGSNVIQVRSWQTGPDNFGFLINDFLIHLINGITPDGGCGWK